MSFMATKIDPDLEDDLRADARATIFFALREAFKRRADQGLAAKDLAEALDKDKAYISRILKGSHAITFESMAVILEALDHVVELKVVPAEQLFRTNRDVRPRLHQATQRSAREKAFDQSEHAAKSLARDAITTHRDDQVGSSRALVSLTRRISDSITAHKG